MRKKLFLYIMACGAFTACRTKPTTPIEKPVPTPVSLVKQDDPRPRQAYERKFSTSYKNDQLQFQLLLQLPEVEIPRSQARNEKLGLPSQPADDKSLSVLSGHVCIQVGLSSGSHLNYTNKKWQALLKIDEVEVANEIRALPRQLLNIETGQSHKFTGKTNFRVCSLLRFAKVLNVNLVLQDSSGLMLGEMNWNSPWVP
jgi:hypothetical protein